MKHIITTGKARLFTPLIESTHVQAAMMVLRPGQSSSEKIEDEHPGAEQWLFVVRGSGRARTKGRSIAIKAGSLLLIEKNEPHQIRNTGRGSMTTLNLYAPPAYTKQGEVKPSVKAL